MTGYDLKRASEILRANIPTPKIERTVDVNAELTATQRQILFETSRYKIKRLLEINPR